LVESGGFQHSSGVAGGTGLADFDDAGHFYDWGLFLSLCKISGLLMIRVHASKPLTVIVKQSQLPVVVLPPRVFSE